MMLYEYKPKALKAIWHFYRNVAKKYKHTYDFEDMERNHMAKSGKWYYAYTPSTATPSR